MNVLGFDTSTAASSACLLRADGRAFEARPAPAALSEPPAHARDLMPALRRVSEEAEVGFAELDAVAVGVGPGGFTGLRIGLATARGLALAHSIPLRPVPSLAALAAGIDEPLRLPLIDARRGELFAALYRGEAQVWEPLVAPVEDIVERLLDGRFDPLAAGDGSLRSRRALEAAGVRIAPEGSPQHVVRALHVCTLAAAVPDAAPEAALPIYLRAPDAQPAR